MAALMGSAEIRTAEYRPCYVKEIEHSENWKMCKENTRETERKALFHRWTNSFDPRRVRWGASIRDAYITTAIVEYEDGTIAEVEPTAVRFVPGIMNEFNFGEAAENETSNATD